MTSSPLFRSYLFVTICCYITICCGAFFSSCQADTQSERLRRFVLAQQAAEQRVSLAPKPDSTSIKEDSTDKANNNEIPNDTIPRITHRAVVKTSEGAFTLGLYGKDAPRTVENFVKLAERKFYRGILVHRVAKDFVVQMGDPKTKDRRKRDEWGNGGESAFGEPFETEIQPDAPSVKRGYKRGTLAMANRGAETNTSQFFVCLRDTPEMPLKYSIFGEVLEGIETLDSIGAQKIIPILNKNDGRPVKSVVITGVSVSRVSRKR